MRRGSAIAVTVLFVAYVGHALLATPFVHDEAEFSEYAGRPLEDAPELALGRVLDEDWYAQLGEYLADRVPNRTGLIGAGARVDLDVFDDNPNPSAVVVAGDWLYGRIEVVVGCRIEAALPSIDRSLDLLQRAHQGADREFHVVVAPTKLTAVPGPLRSGDVSADDLACMDRGYERVRATTGRRPDVVDVASFPTTFEGSDDPDDAELFHRHDRHATSLGSALISRSVVERLVPGLWRDDDLVTVREEARLGDLTLSLGLMERRTSPVYEVVRDDVRIDTAEEVAFRTTSPLVWRAPTSFDVRPDRRTVVFSAPHRSRGEFPIRRFRTSGGDVIPGRTVIVHDSTAWDTIAQLVPYFEDVTFVYKSSRQQAAVEALRGADRTVVITNYAGLATFFLTGEGRTAWPADTTLLAALAPDLASTDVDVLEDVTLTAGQARSVPVDRLPAGTDALLLELEGGERPRTRITVDNGAGDVRQLVLRRRAGVLLVEVPATVPGGRMSLTASTRVELVRARAVDLGPPGPAGPAEG